MNDDTRARHREFVLNSFDSEITPRISPAMNSLIDSMPLGVWFPWKECFSAMDAASDLAESSINWMLKRSVIAGFLEMRGEKKRGTDTRELRLIELP